MPSNLSGPPIAARSLALVTALTLIAPLSSQAQEPIRARASIVFGAFITDRDTETRLDSDFGLGSDIELEEDLGLESSTTVFRFGADVWIKPRQRFDFSLFDLSRSASRQIDETIEFGDQTFVIDTVVSTESDLTIGKIDYTFAVLNKTRGYLGLTGGLYVARTTLTISEATLGIAESEELTAPLPVAGFRGEYAITDQITIQGAAQWFSIDVDDASGSLRDLYVAADYRLGERFAVGIGYNEVTMNVQAEDSSGWMGRLDWGYDGWLLYLKTDFGR